MKKLLIIFIIGLTTSLAAYSQLTTTLNRLAVTAYFALGGVEVTSTAAELNLLDNVVGTTGTGNLVLSAAPTITGAASFTGSATIGTGGASIDTLTSDGTSFYVYDGATQLAPAIPGAASDDLDDISPILADTMLIASFTVGMGNAGDTVLFSTTDVIGAFKWEGSTNLVLTKVTGVNGAASKDIDIAVLHDANVKDDTPTEVLDGDLTITSNTTGDEKTAFTSATIAPGQWVWVRVDQATTQPTQTIICFYGHLTRIY